MNRLRLYCLVLMVGFAALGSSSLAADQDDHADRIFAIRRGQSLQSALQRLQKTGVQLVFTSALIRPQLKVLTDPEQDRVEDILYDLLLPHGLTVQQTDSDVWVVVPAPVRALPSGAIVGRVISVEDGAPIRGVWITLDGGSRHQTSDESGRFQVSGLTAGARKLRFRRSGFVVTDLGPVLVRPGEERHIEIALNPAPIAADTLTVHPSQIGLLQEDPTRPLAWDQEDISTVPQLGGDLFRSLSLLPGVSTNDVSAEFRIRGGRRNETLILLDGQELYAPYHLFDFDNALSIVAPETVEGIDLLTGGFSAKHGDRMSGVVDITTRTPKQRVTTVGVGILNAHLASAGLLPNEKGSWLAQARRGSIDLVGKLLGNESPSFWDGFAKMDLRLNSANRLRANALVTGDDLRVREILDDSDKDVRTEYSTNYLWLTHQAILGPDLLLETAVSVSRLDRDRRAVEIEEDVAFRVIDVREQSVRSVRQEWSWQAGRRHAVSIGIWNRWFDTEYDYLSSYEFDNALADIRSEDSGGVEFRRDFDEQHRSIFVSDRFHVSDPLTLEIGLRHDRHTQTDESLTSPRLSFAYAIGDSAVLRGAWGRFTQSQRPYELWVQDGDTRFYPVEESAQVLLGFEKAFPKPARRGVTALRVEAYERRGSNPLPRYENLYEAFNTFPELEPDRVRIEPQRGVTRGIEATLHGDFGANTQWWGSYTLSEAIDRIDQRQIPRSFDQPHALTFDLNHRFGDRWAVNLAWRYHTGWPTTPIGLTEVSEDGETSFEPLLGHRNSDRLPNYHRLDVRLSRSWSWRDSALKFFVDVQNVYDRDNLAGFDIEIDDEEGLLVTEDEPWAGILPSAGISIEF